MKKYTFKVNKQGFVIEYCFVKKIKIGSMECLNCSHNKESKDYWIKCEKMELIEQIKKLK